MFCDLYTKQLIDFIHQETNMGSLSVQWWIQGEINNKNWSQLLYDAVTISLTLQAEICERLKPTKLIILLKNTKWCNNLKGRNVNTY